ncbi:MAG: DUF4402 domain-containing protein [Ignavibacteriales bacterium]|nr:DUF4402 domain-containing protein [Ignavibacteriales bacterium]
MSRNLFSFALLVAMLVVLVAGNMQAQTVNKNVAATATVMTALTIDATNMAFGNIPASKTAVIDPKGLAHQYVGSGVTVGTVTVTGANSTDVLISWPASISLTQSGKTPLTLTLAVNGDASAANQATAGTLASGADVVTSGAGNYSLWVGGSLPAGAETGLFSGNANFSVEYK